MNSLEELQMDIEELKTLTEQATRSKVKDILTMGIWKLTAELTQKQESHVASMVNNEDKASGDQAATATTTTKPKLYTKTLSSYAWDQSEKFVKIYVTLDGVQTAPKENITVDYEPGSFRLQVADLNKSNYSLSVGPMFETVVPDKSYHKVKSDMVLIMLKKSLDGKTWPDVTRTAAKEKKAPKMDQAKDPNESMMDMMKQMYEDGDDDMKRTITKAMYESQKGKEGAGAGGPGGGMEGMGGMGGMMGGMGGMGGAGGGMGGLAGMMGGMGGAGGGGMGGLAGMLGGMGGPGGGMGGMEGLDDMGGLDL